MTRSVSSAITETLTRVSEVQQQETTEATRKLVATMERSTQRMQEMMGQTLNDFSGIMREMVQEMRLARGTSKQDDFSKNSVYETRSGEHKPPRHLCEGQDSEDTRTLKKERKELRKDATYKSRKQTGHHVKSVRKRRSSEHARKEKRKGKLFK